MATTTIPLESLSKVLLTAGDTFSFAMCLLESASLQHALLMELMGNWMDRQGQAGNMARLQIAPHSAMLRMSHDLVGTS